MVAKAIERMPLLADCSYSQAISALVFNGWNLNHELTWTNLTQGLYSISNPNFLQMDYIIKLYSIPLLWCCSSIMNHLKNKINIHHYWRHFCWNNIIYIYTYVWSIRYIGIEQQPICQTMSNRKEVYPLNLSHPEIMSWTDPADETKVWIRSESCDGS